MNKRMLLVSFSVAILCGVGFGTVLNIEGVSAKKEKIRPEAKMRDYRSAETNEKLDESWKKSIGKFGLNSSLQLTKGINSINANLEKSITGSEYTFVDYADHQHIWGNFENHIEQNSFLDALRAAMTNHNIGDYEPILLVNQDVTQTIMLFERENGKSVKIVLSSKIGDEGKEWFIDGPVEEK
ncbi:hypothetical protein [Brevibacillus gelatini]|uniref:Uncharacterized protein n=1 Tax=Brevibacillus gelatini TaxID=1655277 RepID=A0A3M8AUZ6_9BACL|nr:hypothetical protein [Brevibacillus gelatini]RNB55016.1 hypothetical protein EDM57_15375 [Brevibacillus gelatini]